MLHDIASDEFGGREPESEGKALRDVTALLGCSVEDLTDTGGLARELSDTIELLRLWSRVSSAQTRRAVIEHLRAAVGEI